MVNSGDDESDLLVKDHPDMVDWDAIDWDAHIEEPPAPKKVGVIRAVFKYIGRSNARRED